MAANRPGEANSGLSVLRSSLSKVAIDRSGDNRGRDGAVALRPKSAIAITGGANNDGEVFTVSTATTESVVYSFPVGTNDFADPDASLIVDGAGNLYGTTYSGGANNDGAVFEIN
jgi:hypothetical protein